MALPPVLERGLSAPLSLSSPSPNPPLEPIAELTVEPTNAPGGRGSGDVGAGGVGARGVAARRRTRFLRFVGRWLLPESCRPECFDVQVREGPTRKLDTFEQNQDERRSDVG